MSAAAAISQDKKLVGIKLDGDAGAIIATDKEIALYVDDQYIAEGATAPPHIAKLCLALLIINELERHPNWANRGHELVAALKVEREKK